MDSKTLIVGLMAVNVLLGAASYKKATAPVYEVEPPAVEMPKVEIKEEIKETVEEVEPVETVVYRVTAYCACEKCCGEWANDRELDENGEPIVVGAWGKELVPNYSCASPMAFGTQIELEGIGTVEVQDRTSKWIVDKYGENIIDLYMTDHKTAWDFGVQYLEGVIK